MPAALPYTSIRSSHDMMLILQQGPYAHQCGCNAFDPPTSLWCSGFGGNNWQRPSGLHIIRNDWNDSEAPWISSWTPKPRTAEDPAVIHAMDWGHWASLMFEIAEVTPAPDNRTARFLFGRGGFQGAQGTPCKAIQCRAYSTTRRFGVPSFRV